MRRGLIVAVAGVMLLGGCGDAEMPLSAEDRQFIEAIVALRKAAQEARGDESIYTALKANALSEQRVTEEQLRAYIQSHAQDLDRMAAVWESINVRLSIPTTTE